MAKETIVEESQDFKDDFFKQLKNSVIPTEPEVGGSKTDRLADLLPRKEQLSRALDEETDSIKKMTLRNEIAEVEAEIGKLNGVEELDEKETAEEDLDEDAKKADEAKAKEAEEQDLAAKEQKSPCIYQCLEDPFRKEKYLVNSLRRGTLNTNFKSK